MSQENVELVYPRALTLGTGVTSMRLSPAPMRMLRSPPWRARRPAPIGATRACAGGGTTSSAPSPTSPRKLSKHATSGTSCSASSAFAVARQEAALVLLIRKRERRARSDPAAGVRDVAGGL